MKLTFLAFSVLSLSLVGCGSSTAPPEQTSPAPVEPLVPTKDVLASGTLELGEGAVADKAAAVFVSLRGGPGPPVAAKKLAPGPFPMTFELTMADRPMRTGRPIPEQLTLKIALDGDGNPMSQEGLGTVVVKIDKGATGGTYTLTAPQ